MSRTRFVGYDYAYLVGMAFLTDQASVCMKITNPNGFQFVVKNKNSEPFRMILECNTVESAYKPVHRGEMRVISTANETLFSTEYLPTVSPADMLKTQAANQNPAESQFCKMSYIARQIMENPKSVERHNNSKILRAIGALENQNIPALFAMSNTNKR